jgi:magnesium-dependent phosphatase-1
MPKPINLVVFDADDTLWVGLDGGYIAGVDYQDNGRDDYTFHRLDNFHIQRSDGQRFMLYREVPGILEELLQRGTLISLASYNHKGPATRALQAFGIDHYFRNMVIEFHNQKDRMLQNILHSFHNDGYEVAPGTTLFIDDDQKGKYRQQMTAIGVNFLQRGTDIQDLTALQEHPEFVFQSATQLK